MPRRNQFKPHHVRIKSYGVLFNEPAWSIILPRTALTQRKAEDVGQYDITVQADGEMTDREFVATMAYIRRAVNAYRKQGGR